MRRHEVMLIDSILNELQVLTENDELINDNEKKIINFKTIAYRERTFKQTKNCIFKSCTNKSIKKSHSIQKSKSLKLISEDSHLLQPFFNETNYSSSNPILMKRVGINDASVFPGFCEEHEKLFHEFELTGEFTNERHILLQSYRNICREVVFNTHELKSIQHQIEIYREFRNSKIVKFINNELKRHKIPSSEYVKSITFDYEDNFIYCLNIIIKDIEQKINLITEYQEHLYNSIISNVPNDKIFTKGISIDMQFPISLCGIASTGIEENGIKRTIYCILSVIPTELFTYITIAGLSRDTGILEPYWNHYTQNNISILNMIESFMIHGTDHWFIKPSQWNLIPLEKQKLILNDILRTEKSFLDQFELSIFDQIRHSFISQLEEQQKLIHQQNIEKLITHEKKKFNISNYSNTRSIEEAILSKFKRINSP